MSTICRKSWNVIGCGWWREPPGVRSTEPGADMSPVSWDRAPAGGMDV